MVDIHCHILPDIDDGPETISQSLAMAQMAADCGVTRLAATPHFRGEAGSLPELERMYRRHRRLEEILRQERIPLQLHLGAEILCLPETVELARKRQLPTIGDTDYVLCEFFFDAPFGYMDEILEGIARAGYKIVVAHPERYDAIQQEPRFVHRWFRRGYVIQVNKGSALGAFGEKPRRAAVELLDTGFVHLIASDAHSPRHRTTDMSQVKNWLLDRYTPGYVRMLLEENPGRLLRGEDMVPVD